MGCRACGRMSGQVGVWFVKQVMWPRVIDEERELVQVCVPRRPQTREARRGSLGATRVASRSRERGGERAWRGAQSRAHRRCWRLPPA